MTTTTLVATYKNGVLELPERLSIKEGEKVTVTIYDAETSETARRREEIARRARGMWKGEFDPDEFIERIRERRLINTRPDPTL
ncbi:MAG: DUF104 domain-containing protein [Candidatus Poribacteria bacterium]|nr:DUF104 domain-containing protein [Candidatus Poribacteria bacterium]